MNQTDRRLRGTLTFRSVADALDWHFAKAVEMQGPAMRKFRVERGATGLGVGIDGGRRGDLDEVLATAQTIAKAMVDAVREERAADRREVRRVGRPPAIAATTYAFLLRAKYGGEDTRPLGWAKGQPITWTQAQIAEHLGVSQQAVSQHTAIAVAKLGAVLRARGVVG